jgi:2,4-dienoyl-CoA reductase-like NADH-dependent reductase (Old Yellow Enzyme family)/thioredoxin reductase
MVHEGHVTDQLVAYHRARAQGGVGLIVLQVSGVHESARYTSHVLMAVDDSCIPGYTKLASAIHDGGATVFGQLFHPGKEVMESQDGSLPVALAPSAIPNERFRVMPRALDLAEIREIQLGYGSAAHRLIKAGLDGVEVVASHGYLPSQFLNPLANVRTDHYGGSDENRLRFLKETLEIIRDTIGSGPTIGLRISIDERDPNGLSEEVALEAINQLASLQLVDYVSITTGTSATLGGSDHIVPDMSWPNAYVAPLSRRVKERVSVPVMVAGRINQPQEAERLIASGDTDATVMTRALICDPEMPNRAFNGELEDIRACIACNQACIGHFHAGYPISCIQHPETGRELAFGRRQIARHRKKVLVIGGGPAGLKASSVAAESGHCVTLVEASPHLGGQILLAQALPGRAEFGGAAQNLTREAIRAGVEIKTRTIADLALVASIRPDEIIVATGAKPYRPALEVLETPVIVDAWDIIKGETSVAGNVVVLDWRGDWTGIGTARLLAEQGCRVTLATIGYAAGEALQQYVRDALLAELLRKKISVVPLVRPYGIDNDTVYLQHVLTDEPILLEGVDATVLACGHTPVNHLLGELVETGYATRGVGDCLSPRTVEEAVLDGLVAASKL